MSTYSRWNTIEQRQSFPAGIGGNSPQSRPRNRKVLGVVVRVGDSKPRYRSIPVIEQSPAFEAVLTGPGVLHHLTMWWQGDTGKKWHFHIGFKFRADHRVNGALLRFYPCRPFSMDVAAVRIGDSGEIVPLRGIVSRINAMKAILKLLQDMDGGRF